MSSKRFVPTILLGTLLLVVRPVQAKNVLVDCTGHTGSFSSLSAALKSLHRLSPRDHQIAVSGTCNESVLIQDFENLQLIGKPGATLTAPDFELVVLSIEQSRNVTVTGFNIRGLEKSILVKIVDSLVAFKGCTIDGGGSSGDGMFAAGLSHVSIEASTVQNCASWGIRIDDNSVLDVGSVDTDPVPCIIQENLAGIRVNRSRANIFGATIIRNNSFSGVTLQQGAALFCCDQMERKILDNRFGILVETGGKLEMFGPALIEGSQRAGIYLVGSSAKLFGGGSQTIQRNGTAGDPFTGGIIVRNNSSLDLDSTLVTQNLSHGLVVRESSSARFFGDTNITSNSGDGVRVIGLSNATLFAPTKINNNQKPDLFCSANSFAPGDRTGVGRMNCPVFEPSNEPPTQ